jgi:hypothetical protein
MITHFGYLTRHFIGFLRDPNHPDYAVVSTWHKLWHVCFYYLLISFVTSGIILSYPVEIAEQIGWFDELKEMDMKMGVMAKVFSIIIFAPLAEEGMFRLCLGYYRNKAYFRVLYYISALLFGCVHILNYQFNDSHYFFIPFITMSQTFGGLMLGYIRIIYGFWYGVLLHALFNSLVIGGYFIFDYHF